MLTLTPYYQAVRWATDCGVDIICMSWTIEDFKGGREFPDLKKAIDHAHKNRIIMFCSASDQGRNSAVACYPGAYPGACIRIGSCSASDVPSVWVNLKQVDFLLPGENIVVRNSDSTSESQTGSSFATAVAAGLGGLILYCSLRLQDGIPPSNKMSTGRARQPMPPDHGGAASSSSDEGDTDYSDAKSSYFCSRLSSGRSTARIRRGPAKPAEHEGRLVCWDRNQMFDVFKQMSIPPSKESTLLVKPKTFLVGRLKSQLRKISGTRLKGFDKLGWDPKFEEALRHVMRQLTVSLLHPVLGVLSALC